MSVTPGRLVEADRPVVDLWVAHYPHLADLAKRAWAGNGAATNSLVRAIGDLVGPFRADPAIDKHTMLQWRRLTAIGARDAVPVGPQEVAVLLGVQRATVDQWRQRGLLPEPRWIVSGRPLWAERDIQTWAAETGRYQSANTS